MFMTVYTKDTSAECYLVGILTAPFSEAEWRPSHGTDLVCLQPHLSLQAVELIQRRVCTERPTRSLYSKQSQR